MQSVFNDPFLLDLAINHWGSIDLGLKIINAPSQVVRFNNLRAAAKPGKKKYAPLIDAIRDQGCIPMATTLDVASVGRCEEFDLPITKTPSFDLNDWFPPGRIAKTRKPVIVSTGAPRA